MDGRGTERRKNCRKFQAAYRPIVSRVHEHYIRQTNKERDGRATAYTYTFAEKWVFFWALPLLVVITWHLDGLNTLPYSSTCSKFHRKLVAVELWSAIVSTNLYSRRSPAKRRQRVLECRLTGRVLCIRETLVALTQCLWKSQTFLFLLRSDTIFFFFFFQEGANSEVEQSLTIL